MPKREKIYNLQQILDDLKATKGLPENLSSEAQLWDEIMKKEAFLMPEQLFPLIAEIYGKTYPKGTSIKPLATEYSVERSDTKEISSIRADITLIAAERDIYHFECEIKNDHSMVIRMFEYDVHIALSYRSSPMRLDFPHSAVLYLSDNDNIPENLVCQIHFSDGGTYNYTIPTVKIQSYSLEEIREKHLCVLIPFLPLRFRKQLRSQKSQLQKEELTSFYQQLILILDEEVSNHNLSINNRNVILNLLNKSMIRVFYRDKNWLKEVVTMTEPILELEIEKYIRSLDEKIDALAKLDKEIIQKDEALAQKDEVLAQKDEVLAQKDEALAQKDEALAQKDEVLAQKDEVLAQKNEVLAQKDEVLAQQNEEICALKRELEELRKSHS